MYDKYINFNRVAEEIIRNHKDNEIALQSLREQLAALKADDGVGAIQYDTDPVQVSPTADQAVNRAISKEAVESRIKQLEFEDAQYSKAWEALTVEERQVLETFFCQGMRSGDAASVVMEQFHCERTKAYDMRFKAIRRFKRLLFG